MKKFIQSAFLLFASFALSPFALSPSCAQAQNVNGFYSGVAQTLTYIQSQYVYAPLPQATITVCNYPAALPSPGQPCTNLATLYADPTTSTPASAQFAADSQGNFSFWASVGYYAYTITNTLTNVTTGPYSVVASPGSGGSSGGAVFPFPGLVYATTNSLGTVATSAQVAAALNNSPTTLLSTALLPEATSSTFGTVRPDNSSITIANGVISSVPPSVTIPATSFVLKGTGVANLATAASPGTDYVIPSGSITGSAASLSAASTLPNGTKAVTQTVGDTTTNVATDAFVLANTTPAVGSLSVLSYGAKCNWNGTTGTDDTAAFQAAVNAASNIYSASQAPVAVTVPFGCTLGTSSGQTTINISSGVRLQGPGSIFVPAQSANPLFLALSASDVTFANLNITMVSNLTACGPSVNNNQCSAIFWASNSIGTGTAYKRVNVTNNTIINSGWGITILAQAGLDTLSDVHVDGNTVMESQVPITSYQYADAIHVGGAVSGVTISHNIATGRGDAGVAITSEFSTVLRLCHDISVTGNTLYEDRVGIDDSGCSDLDISGNHVHADIATSSSNPAFRSIYYNTSLPTNVNVMGNNFENYQGSGTDVSAKYDCEGGCGNGTGTVYPMNSKFAGNKVFSMYVRGSGISFSDNTFEPNGTFELDWDTTHGNGSYNDAIGQNTWQGNGSFGNDSRSDVYGGSVLAPQAASGTITFAHPGELSPIPATYSSIIDTSLTAGTSPVCPNGTGGALTTSGCSGGGGGSGVSSINTTGTGAVAITGSGGTTVSTSGSTINVSSASSGGGVSNANFIFVGDSITCGAYSTSGCTIFSGGSPRTIPSNGYTASTTGTATSGSTALTVASASGIGNGELVVGAGIVPGTLITAITGTSITLSQATSAALSSTAVSFGNMDYPSQAMRRAALTGNGNIGTNVGVQGWRTDQIIADYTTDVHPLAPSVTGKPGYMFVMMGTNDILQGIAPATTEANLSAYWSMAHADGWVVIPLTIPIGPWSGTQYGWWISENTYIRANITQYDRVIDETMVLNNDFDGNFWNYDAIHPLNPGYSILAQLADQVIATNESILPSPQILPLGASNCVSNPSCLAANYFAPVQTGALITTGFYDAAAGWQAMRFATTDYQDAAFGAGALINANGSHSNSAFGHYTQGNVSTGYGNSSDGDEACNGVTTGNGNNCFGAFADVSAGGAVGRTQLGQGTNATDNTLQFQSYNFLTSAGAATFASVSTPNISSSGALTIASGGQTHLNDVTVFGGAAIDSILSPQINGNVYYSAGFDSAGIGQAPVAWASSTQYPQCQIVSHLGGNYIEITETGDAATTPGTNSQIWYPIVDGPEPSQLDCAFYVAAASIVSGTGTVASNGIGATLVIPPGQNITNIGLIEPTVSFAGQPVVNIVGQGKASSTIKQGAGGASGMCTLEQPMTLTPFAFASFNWSGFTVDGAYENTPVCVYGAQQFTLSDMIIADGPEPSDHEVEFGNISDQAHGWTFEPHINNVDLGTFKGFGTGAVATATVSGGTPSFTITNGGSGYAASETQVILGGTSASGAACGSLGTTTATISGGVITGITSSASGCVAPLYPIIFSGPDINYGYKFSNTSDGKFIESLTNGNVGWIAGLYTSDVTDLLVITKYHPESVVRGVQNYGSNTFIGLQCDTVFQYCVDQEGAGMSNYYGNIYEWNNPNMTGSRDWFFLNPGGGIPGYTMPQQVNISGEVCGNQALQPGYAHFDSNAGVLDSTVGSDSATMPSYVHATGAVYCNQVFQASPPAATSVTPDFVGSTYSWSNGAFGNTWNWALSPGPLTGGEQTMTLTAPSSVGTAFLGIYTLSLTNPTPSTSSNGYSSPIQQFCATYWTGSASSPFCAQEQVLNSGGLWAFTGANGYSFDHNITAPNISAVSNTTFTNATTTLTANTCSASAVTVTMTGVTTASTFSFTPSTDVSGSTGWGTTGGLVFDAWPTSNTLNYKICNQTGGSVTPGAVTWNVSAK